MKIQIVSLTSHFILHNLKSQPNDKQNHKMYSFSKLYDPHPSCFCTK